jgi:hypothetical protein
MASFIRRLEKKLLREKGKLGPRASASKPKGTPYRHCFDMKYDEQGNLLSWRRYR